MKILNLGIYNNYTVNSLDGFNSSLKLTEERTDKHVDIIQSKQQK